MDGLAGFWVGLSPPRKGIRRSAAAARKSTALRNPFRLAIQMMLISLGIDRQDGRPHLRRGPPVQDVVCFSHRYKSLAGMHLTGMHLIGMRLIGMHLIGMHLIGMHLIGLHLLQASIS